MASLGGYSLDTRLRYRSALNLPDNYVSPLAKTKKHVGVSRNPVGEILVRILEVKIGDMDFMICGGNICQGCTNQACIDQILVEYYLIQLRLRDLMRKGCMSRICTYLAGKRLPHSFFGFDGSFSRNHHFIALI